MFKGKKIGRSDMNKILFDYTYYQSGSRFHGGGEYGDIVLESLLSIDWDASALPGIFYRRDRRVNKELLDKVKVAGWNIHPIRECRNLPHIIKEYGYDTIYSALPYVFSGPAQRRFFRHGCARLRTAV